MPSVLWSLALPGTASTTSRSRVTARSHSPRCMCETALLVNGSRGLSSSAARCPADRQKRQQGHAADRSAWALESAPGSACHSKSHVSPLAYSVRRWSNRARALGQPLHSLRALEVEAHPPETALRRAAPRPLLPDRPSARERSLGPNSIHSHVKATKIVTAFVGSLWTGYSRYRAC